MADTFTARLRLRKPEIGQYIDQWGTVLNDGFIELLEDAIAGVATIDVTAGNHTLTVDDGDPDEDRCMFIRVVGTPGTPRTITTFGFGYKLYIVANDSDSVVTLTNGTSGVAILPGQRAPVHTNLLGAEGLRRFTVPEGALANGVGVDGTATINNVSSGDSSTSVHWMIQGELMLVTINGHTTTFSSGVWQIVKPAGMPTIAPGIQRIFFGVYDVGPVLTPAMMRLDGANWNIVRAESVANWGVGQRILPMNLSFITRLA